MVDGTGGNSYSQVVATFLHNPADIENNKELKRLEQSVELTLNTIIAPAAPVVNTEKHLIPELKVT